jgi:SagB-type dehydrogenase family enzyme
MTIHNPKEKIKLPEPILDGDVSLEAVLLKRRSVREYGARLLTQADISQLLWAAQGVSGPKPYKRTAPSAGGLCPLELFVLIGEVEGIEIGLYRYKAGEHGLVRVNDQDLRLEVGRAAAGQTWLAEAPVVFVFAAVYERTTVKYGERGFRYVHMDAAYASENLHLQAVALQLGTVVMGAFVDDQVHQVVGMEEDERPLIIMPVG